MVLLFQCPEKEGQTGSHFEWHGASRASEVFIIGFSRTSRPVLFRRTKNARSLVNFEARCSWYRGHRLSWELLLKHSSLLAQWRASNSQANRYGRSREHSATKSCSVMVSVRLRFRWGRFWKVLLRTLYAHLILVIIFRYTGAWLSSLTIVVVISLSQATLIIKEDSFWDLNRLDINTSIQNKSKVNMLLQ